MKNKLGLQLGQAQCKPHYLTIPNHTIQNQTGLIPNFVLHISSSWVKVSLHANFHLPKWSCTTSTGVGLCGNKQN